jgi:transcriptional accessory protein Tex/SPT6
VDADKGVADAVEAIQAPWNIIAEMIADDPELTAAVRERTQRAGLISSEAADPAKARFTIFITISLGDFQNPGSPGSGHNRGKRKRS